MTLWLAILALLVLLVVGVLLLVRPGRSAGTNAAAAAAAAAARSQADEPQRTQAVALLAAGLQCRAGSSPQALWQAARVGNPQPEFDAQFVDEQDNPVLTARIAGLPEAAPGSDPGAPADTGTQRAMAALQAPLLYALAAIRPLADGFDASPERRLRVLVGLPPHWSDPDEAWALLRLRHLLHASAGIARERVLIDVRRGSGVALWQAAERLLALLARDERDDLVVVAAAHSDLGARRILELERGQRLFTPGARPQGLIPGEAGVALVLGARSWCAPSRAALLLYRAAAATRATSVNQPGRVDSGPLQGAIGQALAAAGCAPGDVAAVVCDGERHTPRAAELFGAVLALGERLDAHEDIVFLGAQSGHLGCAGVLAAVAAAAAGAAQRSAPCLALSTAGEVERLALLACLESTAIASTAPR